MGGHLGRSEGEQGHQLYASRTAAMYPHGGVRGFPLPSIPGCYVTKFAPHLAEKLFACGTLTFYEMALLHRVERAQCKHTCSRQPTTVAL